MSTKNPEAFRLVEEVEDAALAFHKTVNMNRCLDAKRALLAYIEAKGARIAELEALAAGYDAARLEIASLQARVVELEAETDRLTTCLRKANAEFEHFEREWYLRGDEIEALQAQLEAVGAGGVGKLAPVGALIGEGTMPAAPAQPVAPAFDVRTTAGGRGYVAWFFSSVMRRYDFHDYINNVLAADFACALAKWLSTAPQPAAQALDAKRLSFLYSRDRTDSSAVLEMEIDWLNGRYPTLEQVRDAIDAAIAAQQGTKP